MFKGQFLQVLQRIFSWKKQAKLTKFGLRGPDSKILRAIFCPRIVCWACLIFKMTIQKFNFPNHELLSNDLLSNELLVMFFLLSKCHLIEWFYYRSHKIMFLSTTNTLKRVAAPWFLRCPSIYGRKRNLETKKIYWWVLFNRPITLSSGEGGGSPLIFCC